MSVEGITVEALDNPAAGPPTFSCVHAANEQTQMTEHPATNEAASQLSSLRLNGVFEDLI
jgi:hypothetical protein